MGENPVAPINNRSRMTPVTFAWRAPLQRFVARPRTVVGSRALSSLHKRGDSFANSASSSFSSVAAAFGCTAHWLPAHFCASLHAQAGVRSKTLEIRPGALVGYNSSSARVGCRLLATVMPLRRAERPNAPQPRLPARAAHSYKATRSALWKSTAACPASGARVVGLALWRISWRSATLRRLCWRAPCWLALPANAGRRNNAMAGVFAALCGHRAGVASMAWRHRRDDST